MLDKITTHLVQKYEPKAILMHGSRVRGDYVATSDYDLVVVTIAPEKVAPHSYNGCALDVCGVSVDAQTIETANKIPIWPIEVLFDDGGNIASKLCQQTHEKFLKGPDSLTNIEWENRLNYSQRLFYRLNNRGHDLMLRRYYLGDFYERMVRYWFEKNCRWTVSFFRALPVIKKTDPDFYKNLEGLWAENYLVNARRLFVKIFEV